MVHPHHPKTMMTTCSQLLPVVHNIFQRFFCQLISDSIMIQRNLQAISAFVEHLKVNTGSTQLASWGAEAPEVMSTTIATDCRLVETVTFIDVAAAAAPVLITIPDATAQLTGIPNPVGLFKLFVMTTNPGLFTATVTPTTPGASQQVVFDAQYQTALYVCTGAAWQLVSTTGTSSASVPQTLAQTLAAGNTTYDADSLTGNSIRGIGYLLDLEPHAQPTAGIFQGPTDFNLPGSDFVIRAQGSGSATGGAVRIQGGPTSTGPGGDVSMIAGNVTAGNNVGGNAIIEGGSGGTTNGNGGNVEITAGLGRGTGTCGGVYVRTPAHPATGNAGGIFIETGGSGTAGASGPIEINGGNSSNPAGAGAEVRVIAGPSVVSGGNGGPLTLRSGDTVDGLAGTLFLVGGTGASGTGRGGDISIFSGESAINQDSGTVTIASNFASGSGTSGTVTLSSAASPGGSGGTGEVRVGTGAGGTNGQPGTLRLFAGRSASVAHPGGDIELKPGDSRAVERPGNVRIVSSMNAVQVIGPSTEVGSAGLDASSDTSMAAHWVAEQLTPPTISGGAAPSIGAGSSDMCGELVDIQDNTDVTITFNRPFPPGTRVFVSLTPAVAIGSGIWVVSSSNTGFTVRTANSGGMSSVHYMVMGSAF
jgi:hypothetical protein